jgi:hypothetical protein
MQGAAIMTTRERWSVPASLVAGIWAIQYICIEKGLGPEGLMASTILIVSAGTLGFYLRRYYMQN